MKTRRTSTPRKLLSVLMALALIVGLMPGMTMTARADSTEPGGLAQEETYVAKISAENTLPERFETFAEALNAWSDGTTLTLLDDVEIDKGIELEDGTRTLDLNGYGILYVGEKSSGVIAIYDEDTKLTVVDDATEYRIHYGAIDQETERVYLVDSEIPGETLTIVGGYLTGGWLENGNGGGIFVSSGAELEMTGGAIVGNLAGDGGGVYVYGNGSKFTMGGETVIVGNSASRTGGGVCVMAGGSFEMKGGFITQNEASSGGGVVLSDKVSSFKMSGGSITMNQANDGGGIYAGQGKLQIGGRVQITGNFSADFWDEEAVVDSNVMLSEWFDDNNKIEVISELDPAVEIGVTGSAGVFTKGLDENGEVANFKSDVDKYRVVPENGEAKLISANSIALTEMENGTVVAKVDGEMVNAAFAGDKVTVTATPEDGYKLDGKISVSWPKPVETVADVVELLKNATLSVNNPDSGATISCNETGLTLSIIGFNEETEGITNSTYSLPAATAVAKSANGGLVRMGVIDMGQSFSYTSTVEDVNWAFEVMSDIEQTVWYILVTKGDNDFIANASALDGKAPETETVSVELSNGDSFTMPNAKVTVAANFVEDTKTKNENVPVLPEMINFADGQMEWHFTAEAGQEYTTTYLTELENEVITPDFDDLLAIEDGEVVGAYQPGYPRTIFTRFAETDETLPSDWIKKDYETPTATVTFVTNGGNAISPIADLRYGDQPELPTPTRAGYNFVGWYHDKELKYLWDDESSVDDVAVTLYAKWSATPLHEVTGRVLKHDETTPAQYALVVLKQGDVIFDRDYADENGEFTLSAPAGAYNLVVMYNDMMASREINYTKLVTLSSATALGDIVLSEIGRNSEIDNTEAEEFAATVGGLDAIAAAVNPIEYGATPAATITVTLNVTAAENAEASDDAGFKAAFEAGKTAIKALPGVSGKTLNFLDLTLTLTVVEGMLETDTNIGDTNTQLLTIIIPFDKTGKKDVTVYRYHGTTAEAITIVANADGEKIEVGTDSITLYAKKFSTYAIGYTADTGSSGGTGGTGGYSGGTYTPSTPSGGGTTVVKPTPTPTPAPTPSYANCGKGEDCLITKFDDTSASAWYHDGVHWALENGVMSGYSNTKFGPNDTTSRAMMAQILWNMESRPQSTNAFSYSDVSQSAWYAEAVRWAAAQNIMTGYSSETFGPNDQLAREQLVTILYRYALMKGMDVSVGDDTNILSYDDAFDVAEWAIAAMQWAVGAGIISGRTTSTLNPKTDATRAEIATIMMRFSSLAKT